MGGTAAATITITKQAQVDLELDKWGNIWLWVRPQNPQNPHKYGHIRLIGPLEASDLDEERMLKFIERWTPPIPEIWRVFSDFIPDAMRVDRA